MSKKAVRFRIWAQIEVEWDDGEYEDIKGAWPARVGSYETVEEANAALVAIDETHDESVTIQLPEEEAQ